MSDLSRPLPYNDKEILLMAKWLERAATVNGHVNLAKSSALRLAETLYWTLSGSEHTPAEPAP